MLRPTKIRQYVTLMTAMGHSAEEVLHASRIEAGRLSDPGYLLSLRQCEQVVSNMIRLTGDQAIGFDIGEALNLSDFGIIGQAMLSSRTRRQATEYWIRFSNLVGMLIHITLLEGPGDEWTVVFTATEPMGFIYNFCVEEILVAGIRLGGELGTSPLIPRQVSLSYPAPLHADRYRERFQCPIQFNAACSSLTISSPALDEPLPGHDAELNEIYWRRCRDVMRQIDEEDPLLGRLRSVFVNRGSSLPDMSMAADLLGTSTRTLRRHLEREGTSYQQVVHRFRCEQCVEYLQSTQLSIKEIAGLLGFREVNSLHRAFKAWTGTTPVEFRVANAVKPSSGAEEARPGSG